MPHVWDDADARGTMCHCDKSWTTRRWRPNYRGQSTGSTKTPWVSGLSSSRILPEVRFFFFRFSKADPPGSRPGVSASSRRANNDGLGLQLGRQKEGTANRLDSHRELARVDLSVFFWNPNVGMTGVVLRVLWLIKLNPGNKGGSTQIIRFFWLTWVWINTY